ncbi:unnamed protein product [Peniophora sp. CBMAI 1063]|nr:unnamed protein product [Peniophora sp. CBMAI 1063]
MAATKRAIRFVTFDALYTLLKPRAPIPVQYAEAFAAAGLGTLDPNEVGRSFRAAYKQVHSNKPDAAAESASSFWQDVISLTALGAGADAKATKAALPTLVPQLLQRFSTDEGYRLYPDTIESLSRLQKMEIPYGLITNSDDRILNVLSCFDNRLLGAFKVWLVSDNIDMAKPDERIFRRAAVEATVERHQVVHIGDELENDYYGAMRAGMHALLLRLHGKDAAAAHEDRSKEDLTGVNV